VAKLYFRYAAMNAGKSTALIQVAHNYEERGRDVRVYTAALDHRFGLNRVTSRLGPYRDARAFSAETDFQSELRDAADLACILIDEAQFLSGDQVRQLHRFANLGSVPVICYGIRSDFRGDGFPGAATLLVLAESVEEIKTICRCGRKATMNVRFDAHGHRITVGDQIAIEGDVAYDQMCARCFYEGIDRSA
jgi:thymidine kinase